jgi:hypothetical protein
MSCSQCKALRVERRIETPGQLRQIIRDIQGELANGILAEIGVVSDSDTRPDRPPFSAVDGAGWSDYMEYRFRCARCGTVFLLTAETYHGQGGRWQVDRSSERGAA